MMERRAGKFSFVKVCSSAWLHLGFDKLLSLEDVGIWIEEEMLSWDIHQKPGSFLYHLAIRP